MSSPTQSSRERLPTRDVIAGATRRGRARLSDGAPDVHDAVRGADAIGVAGAAAQVQADAIPGAGGGATGHIAGAADATAPTTATATSTRSRLPLSPHALRLVTWVVLAAAIAATLSLGRAFLAPLAIAAFLAVLLAPIARRLRRLGVPAAIAAAIVCVSLTAAVVGGLWAATEPASRVIAAMPATIDRASRQLQGLRMPMVRLESTAAAIERATGGTAPSPDAPVIATRPNLTHVLYGTTSTLVFGAAQIFAMLFVLLASVSTPGSGANTAPTERQAAIRWRLAAMYHEAQGECLRFMSLLAVTNAFYGVCVGTALGFLGLPNPLLWGIGAMIVEFVPVLGMLTYMAVLAVVALGTFTTLAPVVGALVAVFLINFVVMNLVAPLFVGKKMSVHPMLLVTAVFFWTWTWGLVGAFLATPLVLTARVLVRRLGWLGELAAPDDTDITDARSLRAVRTELVTRLRGSRIAAVPGVAYALGGATRKAE